MPATVVTLTNTTPSAAQTATADTLTISLIGVTASGGAAIVECADSGSNWAPAILGAPNGTTEVRADGCYAFTLRAGWTWRARLANPTAASPSVRVAVE